MELKARNKLICSPLLLKSGADFGGTDLNIVARIFTDIKFDWDRQKECDVRDTKKMEEIA
uniref:Uncharacterized protein n=1 Tax=Siphoviridae sp. ctRuT6 TaxID=2826339 RepID=A0A8S5N3F8_9CAUD|nr:MAG TPA: hypothetical protein [Siphoviridae sp. ctRuT6]